ncbi:MAG TPA: serine hydrolase [Fibrobacteria bacterium]|nr:serine hydrolase [Fibrobacteria bacterium]
MLSIPLFLLGCNQDVVKPIAEPAGPTAARLEITPTPGAPWVARHGLTAAGYQSEFNYWVGRGYRLTYVSGYAVGTSERFAALFEKSAGPAWSARHGMTGAQYQAEYNTHAANGYRLVLVNGYSVNNVAKYVAIWQLKTGPALAARHGLTNAQYQTEFNNLANAGYRLKHVSGYTVNNQDFYAAIWTQSTGPAYVARHAMTSSQYQAEFNTHVANGFRLVDVSGYNVGGTDYYAAIWEQVGGVPWVARHGLSSSQYQADVDDLRYQGYRPVLVNGFASGSAEKYAAIWENFAFSQATLNTIDNLVNAQISTTVAGKAPAISLAITDKGRLVFAKAYGKMDVENNVAATTAHRFRMASVSKPITAIALMKLTELKGVDGVTPILDLESKVFGTGAILGTTYGTSDTYSTRLKDIRVRHLLNHSAGGWPNNGTDPMFNLAHINDDHRALIGWAIDNLALTSDPGTAYAYSNFGYCVLGRVLEKVTGQPYGAWIKSNILSPLGAASMEIGGDEEADRLPNEVKYYPKADAYGTTMEVKRMDAHGGWVATPIDLVRLMVKVDDFPTKSDILQSATLTSMTTVGVAGSGYAKGWAVNSVPNWWHSGGMPGTSSELVRLNSQINWGVAANKSGVNVDGLMWSIVNAVPAWPAHDLF